MSISNLKKKQKLDSENFRFILNIISKEKKQLILLLKDYYIDFMN